VITGQDGPELRRNRLLNTTGQPMTLLLDWSGTDPVMQDNQVAPGDTELSIDGLWKHRASSLFYAVKSQARAIAGEVKRGLVGR
jgi:hypothetical protein